MKVAVNIKIHMKIDDKTPLNQTDIEELITYLIEERGVDRYKSYCRIKGISNLHIIVGDDDMELKLTLEDYMDYLENPEEYL